MKKNELILSTLGHTWILDLDGTIVKHNGYLLDGQDTLIPGALEFLHKIPDKDMIIIVTSREEKYKDLTEKFLNDRKIRYDHIIYNAPYGERILVNDDKPSGLKASHVVNTQRDIWCGLELKEDKKL